MLAVTMPKRKRTAAEQRRDDYEAMIRRCLSLIALYQEMAESWLAGEHFVGYWLAFKGTDTRENRGKQMSSSHQRGPRRERVESRLKKRRYFTRPHQHPTDHGADIGGSVRAHGGDRG